MLHHSHQSLRDKLAAKFDAKKKTQNQPVTIKDIYVYPEKFGYSHGEFCDRNHNHTNLYRAYPVLLRLNDHIESLAMIANIYHQQYYCDKDSEGKFQIKTDCLNDITRACLGESSLYTCSPLSTQEFAWIVESIYAIARKQLPNVHLLLSSFAVLTKERELQNVSLYIQCGPDPKINNFSKARFSKLDMTYKNISLFRQQAGDEIPKKDQPENISRYIFSEKGAVISNNTVFTVKTQGQAEYEQAADPCLDYRFRHSMQLIKQASQIPHNTFLIPEQVDHIVSSNTTFLEEELKITDVTVHIDPQKTRLTMKHDEQDTISLNDLLAVKNEQYPEMRIERTKGETLVPIPALKREFKEIQTGGFKVINPPFGSDYIFLVQKARPLGLFSGELKQQVDCHNEEVKKHFIESHLSLTTDHTAYQEETQRFKCNL